MMILGIIFIALGGGLGLLFGILGIYLGEIIISIFSGAMGAFFTVIGVILVISEINERKKYKNTVASGNQVTATVVDYEKIDGRKAKIICECYYNWELRRFTVSIGEESMDNFPLGSKVQLAITDNEVIYIKGSSRI